MPKYKSPGQKRKGIVRVISIVIFIGATYFASLALGIVKSHSLEWVNDHKIASATVMELSYEEEEYRNLKGRKRYRDIYYLTYSFNIDNNEYISTVQVKESLYSSTKNGSTITIWYASDDPGTSDIESNIKSDLSNISTVDNIIEVILYTGLVSLFIYWILKLIFARESKNTLPDGFYTESSWLDIDDNYVVVLDNNDLVYFNIDQKQSSDVQDAYQNSASLEELLAISKSSKFKRIPLYEITRLLSNHNSDVIIIDHKDDTHSIEFLNQTVKAHALDRIRPLIPTSLQYEKKERTRIQAAIPSIIFLAIMVSIILFFDSFILNLIIGFIIIVWTIPKIFSRLIDPTITERWLNPESE